MAFNKIVVYLLRVNLGKLFADKVLSETERDVSALKKIINATELYLFLNNSVPGQQGRLYYIRSIIYTGGLTC